MTSADSWHRFMCAPGTPALLNWMLAEFKRLDMTRTHSHPCRDCKSPTPCDGTLERNFDGLPEVICQEYHVTFGRYDFRCEGCQAAHERQAEADARENV